MNPLQWASPRERLSVHSPVKSPGRRQGWTQLPTHPLLRDLSPTSTLEALESTEATVTGSAGQKHALLQSIAQMPISDRTWGIKAALAGKKVRAWFKEVSDWRWPSTESWEGYLSPVQHQDETARNVSLEELGLSAAVESWEDESYFGSLPARILHRYQRRIEEIRNDMDTLEIEDVKDYTRSMLAQSRSRQNSIASLQDLSSTQSALAQLDDFQAIVTVTVIQALPYLTRLEELLDAWAARLHVLHHVPEFTTALQQARTDMASAWSMLDSPKGISSSFHQSSLLGIKDQVNNIVAKTGRLLDIMLDGLQGHQDTLPEMWIDELESIEGQLSDWRIELEEKLIYLEERSDDMLDHGRSGTEGDPPTPDDLLASVGTPDLEDSSVAGISVPSGEQTRTIDLSDIQPLPECLEDRSNPRLNRARKPGPLNLHRPTSSIDSNISSSLSSDYSMPGSTTSGSFSNMSSPEIQSASKAEYFGAPVEVMTPAWNKDPAFGADMLSRHSSQRTERGVRRSLDEETGSIDAPATRSRASTFVPGSTIPEHNLQSDSEADEATSTRGRSISVQSFEVVPKEGIKSIMVRRSVSYSSPLSNPHGKADPASPFDTKHTLLSQNFGNRRMDSQLSATSSTQEQYPSNHHEAAQLIEDAEVVPRPSTPDKAQGSGYLVKAEDFGPGTPPVKVAKTRKLAHTTKGLPAALRDSPANVLKAGGSSGDQLEARISSILSDLPGAIHMTSASQPSRRLSDLRHASTPSPRPTRTQTTFPSSRSKAPISDLPQQPHASPDPTPTSSDIKLYHLHQAGKDHPIKLFVRLVGENGERVMVRIGGGWADLGEYLKEYAGHHGSKRTASDGRGFAIRSLAGSEANSPVVATPGSADSRGTGPKSRQSSYYFAKPGSNGIQHVVSPTPTSAIAFDSLVHSSVSDSTHSRPSSSHSRPSSSHSRPSSSSSRPTSRHSNTTANNNNAFELDSSSPMAMGGAGPRKQKVDVSPSKQAWVDGMVEQARRVHADHLNSHSGHHHNGGNNNNGNGPESMIGDLGKAGGTRRVFFRASTTR